MKKIREKYLEWKLKRAKKFGQWYADLIIKQLHTTNSEWQFDYWLNQGMRFDAYMISSYEIYLD